jgi:hypothetical protein
LRRDIFLAVAVLVTACGDDSSSGDEGSAELQQAQKTDGVSATQARADLLIDALCKNAPICSNTTEAACKTKYEDGWMNLVENDADDTCKDAELDRVACLSAAECDEFDSCDKFDDKVADECPEGISMP